MKDYLKGFAVKKSDGNLKLEYQNLLFSEKIIKAFLKTKENQVINPGSKLDQDVTESAEEDIV